MEGNSIIGMAGGFIALAIMLGIGTLILGGAVTDCSDLTGWQGGSDSTLADTDADRHVSWAKQCVENNEQSQSGYALLQISLIVMAAAVVLIVVRLLTNQP